MSRNQNPLHLLKENFDKPVWMLNLLKFKNPYPGAGKDCYRRYTYEVRRTVQAQGGKIIGASFKTRTVIGGQEWNGMILVEYPRGGSLLDMVRSDEYKALAHWRTDAIEDFGFVALRPGFFSGDGGRVDNPFERPRTVDESVIKKWTIQDAMKHPILEMDNNSHDHFIDFVADTEMGQSRIWCINLMKFKDAERYQTGYGAPVTKLMQSKYGGAVTYAAFGSDLWTVFGPKDKSMGTDLNIKYDAVAIMEYASRDAFLSALASKEYAEYHPARKEGLEMQQLVAIVPEAIRTETYGVIGDDIEGGRTKRLLTAKL